MPNPSNTEVLIKLIFLLLGGFSSVGWKTVLVAVCCGKIADEHVVLLSIKALMINTTCFALPHGAVMEIRTMQFNVGRPTVGVSLRVP